MKRKCQWRLPLKSKIPKQNKKTAKEQQRNLRTSKNWNKCQLNRISCVESSPYNYEMRRYPWTMGLHTHFHSGIARHLIEHTLLCVYPRSFSLHFFYIFFTWLSLLIFRICTQIYRCFLFPRFLSSETPFFTLNPLIFRCSFPRFPVTSVLNYSSFRRTYLDVAKLIKSILMLERFHFYEWKNRCFLF